MTLYLLRETDNAREFSRRKSGANGFWVPRSVTKTITKFSPIEGEYRRCEVEIEAWFVKKMEERVPRERQDELGI